MSFNNGEYLAIDFGTCNSVISLIQTNVFIKSCVLQTNIFIKSCVLQTNVFIKS